MSLKDECTDEEVPLITVRDIRFFGNSTFDPEKIESAMDYVPKGGDIILSGYPKTGTTWMQYIIWQILHKGNSFPDFGDMTFSRAPLLEMTGTEIMDALPPPRFYKVHFAYHMMKVNEKAKYICIYRNPFDTVVSYYHFIRSLFSRDFEFDRVFENFLDGCVPYGNYFDHLKSYYDQKDKGHIFLVCYEDLHKNTRAEILRLAMFLGEEYYHSLCEDEDLLQKVLNVTSFKHMKENIETYRMQEKDGVPQRLDFEIIRKGVIGGGRDLFSVQQVKQMNDQIKKKMSGTEILKVWLMQ